MLFAEGIALVDETRAGLIINLSCWEKQEKLKLKLKLKLNSSSVNLEREGKETNFVIWDQTGWLT